jgi:hypothetical protein
MSCSILFAATGHMLVFEQRNEEDKVCIRLLDKSGNLIDTTYEHFSEIRSLTALVTE